MERIDLQAQTLYAELLQRVLSDTLAPSVEKLGRSFVSKKIGKRTYWYLQHRETEGMKQTYLGPETPDLLRVIDSAREAGKALSPDLRRRKELAAAIRAMGFPKWPGPLVATLETLANAGIFHLGAILIGTPAYVVCLMTLGYRSGFENTFTGDIDLQVGRLLPGSMDVEGVLERVKLGFFPVPGLDPRKPSTSFKVRDGDPMVQFLTGESHSDKPVPVSQLGTAAQPMPYMDYLVEESMQAVVPFGPGILVNVPDPARLAWHKQIIADNRRPHERAKARKDIEQAADLVLALAKSDPGALDDRFADAYQRGENWHKKLRGGAARMLTQRPEAFDVIQPILKNHDLLPKNIGAVYLAK